MREKTRDKVYGVELNYDISRAIGFHHIVRLGVLGFKALYFCH